MDERWAFVKPILERSFAPLTEAGYGLDFVGREEFWREHEEHLRAHFPPEAFINVAALRTEAERAGQERIAQVRGDVPLAHNCLLRRDGRLVGAFCGRQKDNSTYQMLTTNIHPDIRRRGVYRMILAGNIAFTGELGFDTILSEHAPGNNPVLIAKLGAGFRITVFDVQPMVGLSVYLTYFHNDELLQAYLFRCGLATLTPRMVEHGSGAMAKLAQQFRDAAPDTTDLAD